MIPGTTKGADKTTMTNRERETRTEPFKRMVDIDKRLAEISARFNALRGFKAERERLEDEYWALVKRKHADLQDPA
jgi:hypothetical protein